MAALRIVMSIVGTMAPGFAAIIAHHIWGRVGAPESVHERDLDTHNDAVVDHIEVGSRRLATYRWGSGEEIILLVHGWHSRASRFAAIVRALQSPNRTIVAFDAPANGNSPGARVTILDYIATIAQIAERHGPFDAVVAHSFGVLSTFVAVREGVSAKRIVAISGMYNADLLVDAFAAGIGISGRAKTVFRDRVASHTFPGVPDPWHRFTAELDPAHVHVPLLVIHDESDKSVRLAQAALIADSHAGSTSMVVTQGLGHSRILRDPEVLALISEFLAEEVAD